MNDHFSLDSIRELYFSERTRRQMIRSQLAVPGSVISFSIFGYVSFAQYFDVTKADGITISMIILMIVSLVFLFVAIVFLAGVEWGFMRAELPHLEQPKEEKTEKKYFQDAYLYLSRQKAVAATRRARSFLLLLLSLGCFVTAVALLPLHLSDTQVHGRKGEKISSIPQNLSKAIE